MASSSEMKGNEGIIVVIAGISFFLCLSFVIVTGILRWLRKRASFEWWRETCGCLGGNRGGSMPSFNSTFGTKPDRDTTRLPNNFDRIQTPDSRGLDNPSFEPHQREIHGLTPQDAEQPATIPQITVTRETPNCYSIESEFRHSSRFGRRDSASESNSFAPRSRASTGEFARQKVVSKPSITSDYVSDMESECSHAFTRTPTVGRYSSRQPGEKKRHRRKHHRKSGARFGLAKHRRYGSSSMTNLTRIDLGKPITRRHSLAAEYQSEGQVVLDPRRQIPPAKTKRQKSASDAHLPPSDRHLPANPWQNPADGGQRLQRSSFRHNSSLGLNSSASTEHRLEPMSQKDNSVNQLPTKASSLVRTGTILEAAVYIQHDRPPSVRIAIPEAEITRNHRASRTGKGARLKPPRTRPGRERNAAKRARPGESVSARDWQYGYGSLPADLGKIKSSLFQEIGMTPESLMKSLEKLDLEKLCRPVPKISEDQRQASPRKPVVDGEMAGHEREILKDTYKLEEFGIVTTDL